MTALIDLIKRSNQNPIRRCYIKRVEKSGDYEDDWTRIDKINGLDRCEKWGMVSIELDEGEGEIGGFNISGISMSFSNDDGMFNSETDPRSLWANYLNRKNTKLKIDCGYLDENDEEVGLATVFEGIIDRVKISDSQKASITVLSYQSIFNQYDISDLSMTGNKTISQIVTLIHNQEKITKFLPYTTPAPEVDATVDTGQLDGSYWDVLKRLALISNSVPYIDATTFEFKSRVISDSVVYRFSYQGAPDSLDITKISAYDDEGADKVRLRWKVDDSTVESMSTDVYLLRKYLGKPQSIALPEVTTDGEKQDIVDALLTYWEQPRPWVEFNTRQLINTLTPLDKINLDVKGYVKQTTYPKWNDGVTFWDDGSKWVEVFGSIIIGRSKNYKVLKVEKDIDSWETNIKAEYDPLGQPAASANTILWDDGALWNAASIVWA